jgi:hypothetical protein
MDSVKNKIEEKGRDQVIEAQMKSDGLDLNNWKITEAIDWDMKDYW